MATESLVHTTILISGILFVSWASIAGYIVVTDWRERRRAEYEADLKRWRQTVDAMRRLYEQDRP